MKINIEKIISADELNLDVELIKSKLFEQEELIVFDNNFPQFAIVPIDQAPEQTHMAPPKVSASAVKIGKYVQEAMRKLFFTEALSQQELEYLTSAEYSNNIFNMNFPVLKELKPNRSMDAEKRDAKGYNRYYNFTLEAYGKHYLLCSQWVEYLHRDKFEAWLNGKYR